jgi:hypothetical protein
LIFLKKTFAFKGFCCSTRKRQSRYFLLFSSYLRTLQQKHSSYVNKTRKKETLSLSKTTKLIKEEKKEKKTKSSIINIFLAALRYGRFNQKRASQANLEIFEECVGQSDKHKHIQRRRRDDQHSIGRKCSHGFARIAYMAANYQCQMQQSRCQSMLRSFFLYFPI